MEGQIVGHCCPFYSFAVLSPLLADEQEFAGIEANAVANVLNVEFEGQHRFAL